MCLPAKLHYTHPGDGREVTANLTPIRGESEFVRDP